jgi:biopolymer transport protein ExbD
MAKRDIPEINAGSMADIAFLLLIFFLVTTTMEKDTAYIRQIPKKLDVPIPPPEVEDRNIFVIRANSSNQLMVRKEMMENPDDISERVVEFYRMNEALSEAQTEAKIQQPSYKGHNFPFYSRVTKEFIKKKMDEQDALLMQAEEDGDENLITFYAKSLEEWDRKLQAMQTLNVDELKEIHQQAHVRIEVQQKTEYQLFAKIHSEIEEALTELRNDAAEEYFGETYTTMKTRSAQDKEDAKGDLPKIKALEVLYPGRIIEVRPKN